MSASSSGGTSIDKLLVELQKLAAMSNAIRNGPPNPYNDFNLEPEKIMADMKKVGRASRRKGQKFELVVAKELEKVFNMKLRRTPLSGGWANKDIGDVIPDDMALYDKFPLYVECRNRKEWSWQMTFDGEGYIIKWMNETVEKSLAVEKAPILVFSKPYENIYVAMPFRSIHIDMPVGLFIPMGDKTGIHIVTLDFFTKFIRVKEVTNETTGRDQAGPGEDSKEAPGPRFTLGSNN